MTQALTYPNRTSWFLKCCECLLTAIGIQSMLMTSIELLPTSFWVKYGQYSDYIVPALLELAFVGGITYSIMGHRQEKTGQPNSAVRYAWLQAIIRSSRTERSMLLQERLHHDTFAMKLIRLR